MNFMRKKPSTPLDDLSALYNDVATKTIQNLALEEKREYKKAIQGWKGLHTNVLYKMDIINKSFASHLYTFDEQNVREGIEELTNKGLDHLERVTSLYEQSEQYETPPSTTRSTGPTYTVPTLRSTSPHTFNVLRSQQQESQKPRLLKTLRSDKPHRFLSPSNYKSQSSSASASLTSAVRTNFSTSKSINSTPRSLSKTTDIDIFDKSFEEDMNFDVQTLRRNETLSQLEAAGQHSKTSRARTTEDLPSQLQSLSFDELDLENHSTPNLSGTKQKKLPIVNTKPKVPSPASDPKISKVQRPQSPRKGVVPAQSKLAAKSTANPVIRVTPVKRSTATPASKLTTRPTARPTASSAAKSATNLKVTPNPQAKPVSRPLKSVSKPSTSKSSSTKPPLKTSSKPKGSASSIPKVERSRSESPIRQDTKDTETINSLSSSENADEMELSEKEIREKMEDQIIEGIRGVDYNAAKQIFNEIVVRGDEVHWDDIAGLETAKNSLKETVVYPFLRPDLFSGLREPARGMLLFGPPGTGKTMLARAVATESKSTFFSISASSLTSKYLGESEKLVRALFMLARELSPAIIFVDEIDSLLSSRTDGDAESSRRIKNEFLVQWSDLTHAAAGKDHGEDLQRVLVLAATNLPWAIDEAARRRFVRRQYIPLPEAETRMAQITKLLAYQKHTLDEKDQIRLVELTEGFSGSDITALAKDAAMGPLRSLGDKLLSTARDEIRPIGLEDFESSLKYIRPSVSKENLSQFDDWAAKFGSSGV